MGLKKKEFFSNLINTHGEYLNFIYKNKKFVKNLMPKVGKIYLVRMAFNSLSLKNSNFLSKNFLGRCIFIRRKNSLNSLFCLRNIYNRHPIELRFFLRTPFLLKIFELKRDKIHFRRNKLYFFRKLSVFKSRV